MYKNPKIGHPPFALAGGICDILVFRLQSNSMVSTVVFFTQINSKTRLGSCARSASLWLTADRDSGIRTMTGKQTQFEMRN